MLSKKLEGIGLSPGVVLGTACRLESRTASFFRITVNPEQVETELQRLAAAIRRSRDQLREVQRKFEEVVGTEYSFIIDAHLLILEDRQFLSEVRRRIEDELASPERAVQEACESWLSIYRKLQDPFFQERGFELREVSDRLITNLLELEGPEPHPIPESLILVGPELSLSALAEYPLERVKGLVVVRAGLTSHVTIIARSYRIPVVSGIEDLEQIHTGDQLIVDGDEGTVQVSPSPGEVRVFSRKLEQQQERLLEPQADEAPCLTIDSRRIHLYGNTEMGNEVPGGLRMGAEGIGLFRSEYIYMRYKDQLVSEEEQFEIYRKLAETVGNRPAVVRTLDIGYEEHPFFSVLTGDRQSVLGLRGVRLSLKYPDIFRAQIRAILRAGHYGFLRILLPMVSSVDEVVQAREVIGEVAGDLLREGHSVTLPEIGVMLEVPAAVLILEKLADHADFLAVGTNDLIQYTLAVGRNNEQVAELFNPLHPAVLASMNRVAQVTSTLGKQALVCGEMAAQPLLACILVGMGYQHLSMNPFSIPEIKRVLREVSYSRAAELVSELLSLPTVQQVEAFVKRSFQELQIPLAAQGWPEGSDKQEVIE